MGFVVISERKGPGQAERLTAMIYIREGRTRWFDGHRDVEYPQVDATNESLRALERGTPQGDRRMTYIDDDAHLEELRRSVAEHQMTPA